MQNEINTPKTQTKAEIAAHIADVQANDLAILELNATIADVEPIVMTRKSFNRYRGMLRLMDTIHNVHNEVAETINAMRSADCKHNPDCYVAESNENNHCALMFKHSL